jgi:hypothetical protein
MPYLITELSPHIPLLAVTTLALFFVVNPVWSSASVTLTYYLFDFLIGSGAFASPTLNTDPFPFLVVILYIVANTLRILYASHTSCSWLRLGPVG